MALRQRRGAFLCLYLMKILVDGLRQLPAHAGGVFQLVGGGFLHCAHALELRQQGFGGLGPTPGTSVRVEE